MNLDPRDPSGARNRLVVKLLGGLVVAGVVIGLTVGIVGTTVLRSLGLEDQPPPETVSTPEPDDTFTPEPVDEDDEDDESASPDDEDGRNKPVRNNRPHGPRAVLNAQPNPAQAGVEITLSGRLRGLHGGTLQVQRREGGVWTDFPVTAAVNPNGTFSTYIITSRTGTSPFRLLHEQSGRNTPPVRITIG